MLGRIFKLKLAFSSYFSNPLIIAVIKFNILLKFCHPDLKKYQFKKHFTWAKISTSFFSSRDEMK